MPTYLKSSCLKYNLVIILARIKSEEQNRPYQNFIGLVVALESTYMLGSKDYSLYKMFIMLLASFLAYLQELCEGENGAVARKQIWCT
jgi:hypothetical protein